MKTILILPNKFSLEDIKKNLEYFNNETKLVKQPNSNTNLFNYNEFNIKEFSKVIEYDNNEYFMDNITCEMVESSEYLMEYIQNLNEENKENMWGECKFIQDIDNIRYELIFFETKIFKETSLMENHLGSLLTREHIGVCGPCVIIGTKSYYENNELKHEIIDIDYEKVFQLLVNKIVMKGLYINDNCVKDIYISSTRSLLSDIDIKLFNENFTSKVNGFEYICYYSNHVKLYVNILATKFFNRTIYGDILLFSIKDGVLQNINLDIFYKNIFTTISYEENEKIPFYVTFLEEYKKYNVKCKVCDNVFEKVNVCSKCKKEIYCSKECQIKNWIEHQKICLS